MNFSGVFSTIVNKGIVAVALGVMCLLANVAPASLPQIKLENPDEGILRREMGRSVAVDGDTLIVGVTSSTSYNTIKSGTALIYRADGMGGWTLEAKLFASEGAEYDQFGLSVAVSGDMVIVGAPGDNHGGVVSGSAYVFTRSDGIWTEVTKLTASDAAAGHRFGWSVALSGDTAIIGASFGEDGGFNTGSAYVFTLSDGVWTEHAKLTASDAEERAGFGTAVSLSGDTVIVSATGDAIAREDPGSAYVFTRSNGVWTEQARLAAGDAATWDNFGNSVALFDDTAIVAARWDDDAGNASGSAYVFIRTDGIWTEQAKLTASDASDFDEFGRSVAIWENTAIIGTVQDDDGIINSGSAYVFTRSDGVWSEQGKLTASDASVGDLFGSSVALSGGTAIVGATHDNDGGEDSGSAYVFTQSDDVWTERAKLTSLDAAEADRFGRSVALSGDTMIVGAWSDNVAGESTGSVYVSTRSNGLWTELAKLTASDAATQDYLGHSVAISGDTAIVGGYRNNDDGGINSGAAYVFTRSNGIWTEVAKLTAADAAAWDVFGTSLAISGDTAIVGAQGDGDVGLSTGSAYIFTRSGGVWAQEAKLTASDAAVRDYFGYAVALSDDTVIVGADGDDAGKDSGSAYVFTRSHGLWTEQAKLTASDAEAGAYFGTSVAISGNTAIIGAYLDSDGDLKSGSAYIFTRSDGEWTEQAKLTASDAAVGDFFGRSVALSGDTAIVGASGDNDAGSRSGSAYVFRRSNGVWTQVEKLTAADPAEGDRFGQSVATDGFHALVGAPYNDDPEPDSGAAYVFTLPLLAPPSFTFTQEEQETPSLAWNFVVPSAFDGTITGSFDAVNERLATITSTNRGAFGFWESPQLQVTDSDSNATTALFIRGEAGEDALFRARWTLSSDDGVDQVNLPTIRVRAGSTNYSMTSEILATSKGNGDFSPTGDGSQYDLYYVIPAEDNLFRLSFDVINFDPTDAAVASLFIDEIILESISSGDLGAATSVASYDFADDAHGFTTRNASPDLVAAEIFTSTADGLLVRGVEPSPTRGESSDIIFGFWGVETDIAFTGGKLYRVTWTIGSDAETGRELEVPTFRLRVNDSSLKFASLLHVNSYDETARVPVEGSSQEYNLWLVAPNQINGSQWTFSFDYLAVGGVPTSEDDPTIGLYLEALRVEEYTP